ncbi:MAG: hypothetical protein IKP31_05920 [Lachnospiraceae bacterium]|nr:hypothetical protein [Lachnospiraceae bacterium]
MDDFLRFFNEKRYHFPMHMEIYYSKIMDWCIDIYKKGCAADYPDAEHDGDDVVIVKVQDLDMELCFARAHVALKEWLMKYEKGY